MYKKRLEKVKAIIQHLVLNGLAEDKSGLRQECYSRRAAKFAKQGEKNLTAKNAKYEKRIGICRGGFETRPLGSTDKKLFMTEC